MNEHLCARILELEEQNALLLNENSVLTESVKLYLTLLEEVHDPVDVIPPRTGQASTFRKGQRRRRSERAAKVIKEYKNSVITEKITSDMAEDTLMAGTLNYLTALVKQLSLSKAKRAALAQRRQEQELDENAAILSVEIVDKSLDREEALEDSLRHVFVDALHLLSECIIAPESTLNKEIAEYYEALEEAKTKRLANAESSSPNGKASGNNDGKSAAPDRFLQADEAVRHPITWLLDQFPVLPKPRPGTIGAFYDYKDWLPLHWSIATDANEVVDVETLLNNYGADEYYGLGMPPLLLGLAKAKPSLEISTTLISHFNASDVKATPLVPPGPANGADAVAAEATILAEPTAAGLPLPGNIISEYNGRQIVDIVSTVGEDGLYPLQIAAAYNEDVEILKVLQEVCPESAWEPDVRGWRAIHYAALKGTPDVVKWVLEQHPKCCKVTTKSGLSALHFAAQNQQQSSLSEYGDSLELLTEVFNGNPGAISAADESGALPLHLAAKKGTLESVQFLCQTYPTAITVEDKEGRLPMHYTAARSELLPHKTEIVQILLV